MLSDEILGPIVDSLARRPGHERVRSYLDQLLREGLGARGEDVRLEHRLEVRGRADALLGRTVFEIKANLAREQRDAEGQLLDYLRQRETTTGEHWIGVATDGLDWQVFERRAVGLQRITEFRADPQRPRQLLLDLTSLVSLDVPLETTPETVTTVLGRRSTVYRTARARLAEAWAAVSEVPDVALKRQLWAQLLERVYGTDVDADELFFQHTYLTIVAKAMATLVLGYPVPQPRDLLSGRLFTDRSVRGLVESDLFDWVLEAESGRDVVSRLAHEVDRFDLREVKHDVLKALYESLIDPEQRHDLGEYYTPDWLADRMVRRVITDPLKQRVLDPACGSGTFVLHAVRHYLAAADAAGLDNRVALEGVTNHVMGIEVHPVAALIARVTYLLAIGSERLGRPRGEITIPVFLGDGLQWNTAELFGEREVVIKIPKVGRDEQERQQEAALTLEFPASIMADSQRFERIVATMLAYSEHGQPEGDFSAWLLGQGQLTPDELLRLARSYGVLAALAAAGRDHIWGYVARNLGRPLWLSLPGNRPDIVIGNPPWVAYRSMSAASQAQFKRHSQQYGLWAGGKVATHQDLSATFFVTAVDRYLEEGGRIAFVLPYAALDRQQFAPFRTGSYRDRRGLGLPVQLRFDAAWGMDSGVQPLFPVPSCVLFATKTSIDSDRVAGLPAVSQARGRLPQRDATLATAERELSWAEGPWPAGPVTHDDTQAYPYRKRFLNGATVVPRMLFVVDREAVGGVGSSTALPLVVSHRSSQEKPPWKTLPPLRGPVEAAFLRPLLLGESIAPFRVLGAAEAVIPGDAATGLLDSRAAARAGHSRLADWLRAAEALWVAHRTEQTTLDLGQQLDYYGKLSSQFPIPPLRVVYAASGTMPAAARLVDADAVVEHKLYWASVDSDEEAHYLCAIINSETARARTAQFQSQGQWGARDFDKVIWSLPIPRFDEAEPLHRELAAAALQAEHLAAELTLPPRFIAARQAIRVALTTAGITPRIDQLVARLLDDS